MAEGHQRQLRRESQRARQTLMPVLLPPCLSQLRLPVTDTGAGRALRVNICQETAQNTRRMLQEFQRTLTRELKEDVAEFESEYYRSYPVGSIGQTNLYSDLLLKTSYECAKILEGKIVIYLLDCLHDVLIVFH